MPSTPHNRYQFAAVGEANWHKDEGPENIWSAQEKEIIWYGTEAEKPSPGVSDRKWFSTDVRILWYDGGDQWVAIAGLGSQDQFLPTAAYLGGAKVNNDPTDDLDVARKIDLDELETQFASQFAGKADDPHGDAAHSEDYLKTGDAASLSSLSASTVTVDILEFNPLSTTPTSPSDASMWFEQ